MSPSFILVCLSLFTWGVGEGLFLYFLPIYMQQLGASPVWIGSLFGGFALMMLLAHIPAGYLADRLGRRPLLQVAWLLGTIATFMMALAHSLPLFAVGYLLYGLTGFVSSPLFSYVTAARGKLEAGRAMTLVSAFYSLGAVLGPVSGGWIGEYFSMRVIFMVSGVVFVLSTILVLFLRSQPRDEQEKDAAGGHLLSNTRFITFLGVIFLANFVMYLPQPLTPNFLQSERGVTLIEMGVLGSIGSLGNVVMNLILGQFNARLGYLVGQAAVALAVFSFWRGIGLPWYALGYLLLGGYRASRALAFAQIRWLIQQAQMGLAYGIAEAFSALGIVLAPLLAGYLYERDPASIYALSLFLVGFGVLISLIFAPHSPSLALETEH